MNRENRWHARAACPRSFALRPLCAFLATLPLLAGAQERALDAVNVTAPRSATQPLGASAADAASL